MKNRIKGCTHHDSKVVQKLAAGGRVGSRNSDPAGPRGASNSSRASGGGLGNSMGSSRANNGSMGSRSSNPAGPRRDSGGLNASSASRPSSSGYNNARSGGNISNNGLGLRTGTTWSGNTAYGQAGGRAMGFARNPAEAKAKMAAAARPKGSSAVPKPTARPVAPKPTTTAIPRPKLRPGATQPEIASIPNTALMYPFEKGNFTNGFLAKGAPYERKAAPTPEQRKREADRQAQKAAETAFNTQDAGTGSRLKRDGILGAGYDERVPQDSNRKTKSGGK